MRSGHGGSSNARNWLLEKDPDAGKDWGQEEKGVTEDEMVGWHYWLNGHEFEQIPGDGEGQGSLEYCSPWGHKESDMSEWLNNSSSIKGRKTISIRTMPCYALVTLSLGGCSYPKSHVWDRKKFSPYVLRMRISESWKSQLTKYIWMNFFGGIIT